jgi:RNA recognition motif-containing protein
MKSLFVGNLSFSATEDMLRSLFGKYGTADRINMVTDRDTGKLKGFGFVDMNNDEQAAKAISALNGTDLERPNADCQ